jgi:two-component system, NtrC family, response regulator AtoC
MLRILLVDDEPSIRLAVGDRLRDAGFEVDLAQDGAEASERVRRAPYDLVVTDIRLPRMNGLALFRQIRSEHPETDVILITAYGTVEDAVSALKEGARDYLTKPFDVEELLLRILRLTEHRILRRDLAEARGALRQQSHVEIIGKSPPMARLLEKLQTLAPSDAPVLITGESGTGKELVAHALHDVSPRHERPFVPVNCAAFPETLLEAELFGHERGAFTGAIRKRDGRFRAAHKGTLFLDEVSEIPIMAQAKLLRVLQEHTFEPIGTNTPVHVDVRIVSATNRDLKARIKEGLFREDLYYRLNVLDLNIPPLRDRRGDLPVLVEHFMRKFTPESETSVRTLSPSAWAALSDYPFPGNVRELENAIERACVLSRGGEIQLDDLPADIAGTERTHENLRRDGTRPLATAIKEFEREYLLRALQDAEGKKAKAADLLGISRKNLWEKLKGHDITDSDL